jgi:hypothetical protein
MSSQYILSAIIVLIGWGWTINFMKVDKIDDMAVPLIIVFGIINLIIQV